MAECPFSRERLGEMRWLLHWPISAIAVVATNILEEKITEEMVTSWFVQMGVSLTPPPKPGEFLPPGKGLKPRARSGRARNSTVGRPKDERKRITRPCAYCQAAVTRYASEFTGKGEIAYCNAEHQRLHLIQTTAERKEALKTAVKEPDIAVAIGLIPPTKTCAGPCGLEKPITAFSLDISRRDGHARICLECNKAKSQAYYAANRERQIAKVQQRRRKQEEGHHT